MLLSLGCAAVFDSRNIASFERGVREVTGDGVDVVLNSLAGPAIVASLKLLRPMGRFVELGKRDQYEETHVSLGPFLGGLSYFAAHLDVLMLSWPTKARKLLEEVWRELSSLPALPTTSFSMANLPNSLEFLSKGTHIGKVLVTVSATPVFQPGPGTVAGPVGDSVAKAIRGELGNGDPSQSLVCVPDLASLRDAHLFEALGKAGAVVTASTAVATLAKDLAPQSPVLTIPNWEPVAWAHLQQHLVGSGPFVAVEEEGGEDLREWLMDVVTEMVGDIGMDDAFEDAGLDSLSLISLARRLSTKIGKAVSVSDVMANSTPQRLLAALSGGPVVAPTRPRVVCLHGWRANAAAMEHGMSPYSSAVGVVEWVFMTAPRRSTGPQDPSVPSSMDTYEWWGQRGGSFEKGWMMPHTEGFEESEVALEDVGAIGVVGFSQGGAAATLVSAAWAAFFSAVEPPIYPRVKSDQATFHTYDLLEEHVQQSMRVESHYDRSRSETYHHSEGHTIPRDPNIVAAFAHFVVGQLGTGAGDSFFQ